jgi:16S rRNA (cytidine1402-2'-O)-methyltransferase
LLQALFEGYDVGVLSESGCPGIADPGALAVAYAHKNGIRVIPLVGPSSIVMGLMSSGLNGQHFAFHGYLPIQPKEACNAIVQYEKESRLKDQTQIFIETPYRNNHLFANLVRSLAPETRLCVAIDITGPNEFILTQPVKQWRQQSPELRKEPAVFLFLA